MTKKIRVGVAGYGTIGQRLADGVALQGDMELVGVADLAPTLAIRALKEKGIAFEDVEKALAVPRTDLRLFGKPESFVKRRMGVAVANGKDTDEARQRAKQAAALVRPVKA